MRILLLLALALALAAPSATAAPADELVAQLAAGTPGTRVAELRARLAPRLAALGVTLTRGLADGIALPPDALGAGAGLDGFEPQRVVMLVAPDAATAEAARTALGDDPAIDWVEPNRTRSAQVWSLRGMESRLAPLRGVPLPADDPLFAQGYQYGLWNPGPAGPFGGVARADAHAIEAWAIERGRESVKIAVADTGVDPDHPDLAGFTFGGVPRLADPFNATNEAVPVVRDSAGHGTPVMGVTAARSNNGASYMNLGVASVAGGDGVTSSGVRLVPIKISPGHSSEASAFDIARALLWATSVGARAMNLSYADDDPSTVERAAMQYAILHGCVMVAAAGNKGYSDGPLPQYPAAHAAEGLCIQVGASNALDQRVVFSSYGPGLDFMAAGIDVWTTFMTYPSYYGAVYPGYVAASGTSFAAPFGTAAVGLLASYRPELQDTDFQHVLRESADDIGTPGVDEETGWGRLNLARALESVAPSQGIWHDEVAAQIYSRGVYDTLVIGESGPGTMDRRRARLYAERIEARAKVTLPDSFQTPFRVWPRLGGTFAVRGDFRLPWFTPYAEVIATGPRTFTLRGYIYRALSEPCPGCDDRYVPLPPDQVRFGFTVIAPVDRAPAAVVAGDARATPNPFRGRVALALGPVPRAEVFDLAGRRVRALEVRGDGTSSWDGRDDTGRALPAGLYLVRWRQNGTPRMLRIAKLDR